MSDPFDDNVCSKSEEKALVQAATEAGLRTTIKVLNAELAAVQETARMQHEALQRRLNENSLIYTELEALHAELTAAKADLSRHKRAIDMARTTLEYVGNWGNDPTSVAIARNCEKGLEEISRILEGKE